MWPFGKKRATRLASSAPSGAPTEVRVEVVVASPNDVTSELTGLRAALFLVTLVERRPVYRESGAGSADEVADTYVELGSIMWGDTLVLRDDDGTAESLPLAAVPSAIADAFAARTGFDPRRSTSRMEFIWIRPTRIQAWREEKELPDRDLMRDGAWLA